MDVIEVPIEDSESEYHSGEEDEEVKSVEESELSVKSSHGLTTSNATQTHIREEKEKKVTRPVRGMTKKLSIITPNPKPKKRKITLMGWKKYHRLNVVYRFMEDLERDFPALVTVTVIGKTVEGRDIKMLKISNSHASNTAVWIDACIHSREWISTSVVTYIADQLVRNFKRYPSYITSKDWHIVPILNPDGYEHSHTQNRMWRKNRACYDGKCVGVDLNRNFSFGWGNNGEEGSSEKPDSAFFRGPEPFSEPETSAVRNAILGSHQEFKVFLSFHSYFQSIIFPWGFKVEPCPDYFQLLEGGILMSRAIQASSGLTYKVGSTKDLTYFACGTSIDWSYAIAKIPFSYMIELRSRKYKFKLPRDQIVETCVENWNAVQCLLEYVDFVS